MEGIEGMKLEEAAFKRWWVKIGAIWEQHLTKAETFRL